MFRYCPSAHLKYQFFIVSSFHQRYLAPAGRVVRRQHIPAHLPRFFDALGELEACLRIIFQFFHFKTPKMPQTCIGRLQTCSSLGGYEKLSVCRKRNRWTTAGDPLFLRRHMQSEQHLLPPMAGRRASASFLYFGKSNRIFAPA